MCNKSNQKENKKMNNKENDNAEEWYYHACCENE